MTTEFQVKDSEAILRWLILKFADLAECAAADVDINRPFAEYDLDSSVAVSVGGELGKLLDQELPVTLFWEFPNMRLLATALAEGARQSADC
jgi:acyl carrier protein